MPKQAGDRRARHPADVERGGAATASRIGRIEEAVRRRDGEARQRHQEPCGQVRGVGRAVQVRKRKEEGTRRRASLLHSREQPSKQLDRQVTGRADRGRGEGHD